jgi:predicted DCC family thiol-disulfide oxidoreductase YuxK
MAGSTSQPRHVAHPPRVRPVLLFDGECTFCRRWGDRWREAAGDGLDLETAQTAADRFPEIPPAEFARAVQLIDTDGRVFSGAEAIIRARALATPHTWLRTAYERLPGFAPAAEAVYRFVARHRTLL